MAGPSQFAHDDDAPSLPAVKATDSTGKRVDHWLQNEKKPDLAASTFAIYEAVWRLHVKPLIGKCKLENITTDNVIALYATLRGQRIGSRTVPRHVSKEPNVLTDRKVSRFIQAAKTDKFEGVWLLSLFGGLRLGASLGLKWADVNLHTGEIDIRQQASVVSGAVKIGPLKTKSSGRRIIVGHSVLEALRRRQV
jgi:integrase